MKIKKNILNLKKCFSLPFPPAVSTFIPSFSTITLPSSPILTFLFCSPSPCPALVPLLPPENKKYEL